ncbi:hypothetical protein BVI434_560004 [Burkholderia vietnamiensis]|nr:hypothetical protein BVI434_560004 [Burkholderia vietnamiensis]
MGGPRRAVRHYIPLPNRNESDPGLPVECAP